MNVCMFAIHFVGFKPESAKLGRKVEYHPEALKQTVYPRRWSRVGESESEWAGPRCCHGGVARCRSSNA